MIGRVAVLLTLVLLALVVGGIVLYPTPLLGMNGAALAQSITDETADAVPRRCRETSANRWRCVLAARGGSESVDYRVTVDWKGCWSARSIDRPADGPQRLSGCVRVFDHDLF